MNDSWRVVIFSLAIVLGGCSDNNGQKICLPGATQVCVCAGGAQGAQACDKDGTGWGQCQCSTKSDAAVDAPKSDAPKLDIVKADVPLADLFKTEATKPDAPKPDSLKADSAKPDAPKPDAPKPDAPKSDLLKPDIAGSSSTFGKVCTNGSECKSDAPDCVSVVGGSGIAYCTKSCSTLGGTCSGSPSGMYGVCLLSSTADSGSKSYSCGFLCKYSTSTYTCPTGMKCTSVYADSGTAVYGYCN
jgi:hypothetical protein